MEYKDFLGHEIMIGDTVVYVTGGYNSLPAWRKGTVVDLVNKGTEEMPDSSLRLEVEGCKRLVTLYNFDKCVVAAK